MRKVPRKWFTIAALAALLAGFSSIVMAQSEDPGRIYRPVTHVDFEKGDVIEAPLPGPDAKPVVCTSRAAVKNLIRLREDFHSRIVRSAGDL